MQDATMSHERRSSFPLVDRLGELCISGRDSAAYLWQVPGDGTVRAEIAKKLLEIHAESERQGRREMTRIADDLQIAVAATPSPQQVEILQDGFDRLVRLWQAAKSGLM
jgi:hypothetical protein